MDILTRSWNAIDAFLIAPYRWPADPVVGWWVGTILLALWAVLAGDATLALAYRVNRFRVREVEQEMMARHHQSINALKAGDKSAYKAINKLANDAFGESFFLRLAMACAALWPAAMALAWLQSRFSHIRFPLPFNVPLAGKHVGYAFVFIPLYILVRIVFGKAKGWWKKRKVTQ
ncbi:MAG: hypothetical protein JRK53_02445 [Deltaproteobacteria bacterium]|nr:hypothetical protein [Deltaproteobacteria bacterium]MBW1819278.1 hypothetical protein [Deltaproteobacteria bacterium]